MSERIKQLKDAVEAERAAEEQFYKDSIESKSIQDKVANGMAWYPVDLVRSHYTVGEYVEIEVESRGEGKPHKMKTGAGVSFFVRLHQEEERYSGTISFLKRQRMRIILHQDDLDKFDLANKGLLGVELVYDERPYKIMQVALDQLLVAHKGALSEIKTGIDQLKPFDQSISLAQPYTAIPHLNDSQNLAIKGCLESPRLSIIHGPPGTGKTTTIVGLVGKLLAIEKRILVCAPSNNAVDLLAYRIHMMGHKVLRLGNITRVDDDLVHLTLQEKVRELDEWGQVKKIKIQAEELSRKALKYKRSFGAEERAERRALLQEARDLRKWSRDLEERITQKVISQAEVILCTLIGAASSYIDGLKFGTVIVDEASQALEPECWNVIPRADRTILVGDHKQLPPTVKSTKAKELGLEVTLLDRMSLVCHHTYLLDMQYRMNDQILAYSNTRYYEGKLKSATRVAQQTLLGDPSALMLIDTAGAGFEEKRLDGQLSSYNEGEWNMIREHLLLSKERLLGHSIGIITPYAEQVRYIKTSLGDEESLQDLDISVDSIDGFQGQERDVIYLSLVRSNDKGEIGFLADERRLNVGLTRAKLKLIIVGDSSTVAIHEPYRALLELVEQQAGYHSAWEFML